MELTDKFNINMETGEILDFEPVPEWTDHEAPMRAPLVLSEPLVIKDKPMSILDSIITTKPGAPRITIYGKPGIGKSTLASQFPDPLFLLTEDNELPGIKALPLFTDYLSLWQSIKQLLELETLPFKTLVIDSISKLDALVVERTITQSPPDKKGRAAQTLAEAWGGYGAGFEKATSLHRAIKVMLDRFKERGIIVVYISHSEVKKYKSPEHEDYDILSIVMNSDKSRAIYIDDVDAVLYCKLKSHTLETDSGRTIVKSSGQRVISGISNEVYVSKNRFNLPPEIPMSFDDLATHIPFFATKTAPKKEKKDAGSN
jgi:hypothetical protein